MVFLKKCNECEEEKELDKFHKLESGADGCNPKCADCRSKIRGAVKNPRPAEGTLAECANCGEILDESKFSSDKTSNNGLQTYCKDCQRQKRHKSGSTLEGFISILFKDLKKNAKRRGISVEITKDYVEDLYYEQEGKCALSGEILTHQSSEGKGRNQNLNNISVDRIDSDGHYTKENVHLVCMGVNAMKNKFSLGKFKEKCKRAAEYQEREANNLPPKLTFKKQIEKEAVSGNKATDIPFKLTFKEHIKTETPEILKECDDCGNFKELNCFHISKSGSYGRHPKCKDCRSKGNKKKNNPRPPEGTLVNCLKCNKEKDQSEFGKQKSAGNGLQTYCKTCKNEENIERFSTFEGFTTKYYATLRCNARKRNIRVEITVDDIRDLYHKQNGLCKISGTKMTHNCSHGKAKFKHPDNISVDRIDSDGHYTRDNIQVVCGSYNVSKWDLPDEAVKNFNKTITNYDKEISKKSLLLD